MTDTVVICLTALVALVLLVGAYFLAQHKLWQRELTRLERSDARGKRIAELSEQLSTSLGQFEDTTSELTKEFHELPKAVLALSERQVVLENAIKNALAEIVRVTGYTEAKHQALVASTVTASRRKAQ